MKKCLKQLFMKCLKHFRRGLLEVKQIGTRLVTLFFYIPRSAARGIFSRAVKRLFLLAFNPWPEAALAFMPANPA
jgi:hypothetical protein